MLLNTSSGLKLSGRRQECAYRAQIANLKSDCPGIVGHCRQRRRSTSRLADGGPPRGPPEHIVLRATLPDDVGVDRPDALDDAERSEKDAQKAAEEFQRRTFG